MIMILITDTKKEKKNNSDNNYDNNRHEDDHKEHFDNKKIKNKKAMINRIQTIARNRHDFVSKDCRRLRRRKRNWRRDDD